MVTIMNILICCKTYNTAWTELQKSNEISFTKLPYGNYTLKVRYKNDVYDSNAREYLYR